MKFFSLVVLVFSLIFVSCKKETSDKFPIGDYEFQINSKLTNAPDDSLREWSFPVRITETSENQLSIIFERKDENGNVTYTYPTGFFNLTDKKNVVGEIDKGFFGAIPMMFSEGELKRKWGNHIIEGNVDYQSWNLDYQKWHYFTGTFIFKKG